MDSFKDSLAFWSSILATALGVFGLNISSVWLNLAGVVLLFGSVAALLYAQRERQRLKLSSVKIEGKSIDALNVANLGRRMNRSLIVQEAEQVVRIHGTDAELIWHYSGYCRAPREAGVEFSIDTDNSIPFEQLDCVAYDLRNDPQRSHGIRPALIGADGLSKKIMVPLLKELHSNDPFEVWLRCRLPGCMKPGIDYYSSTVSLAQSTVGTSRTRLVFTNGHPKWLRVYECGRSGTPKLINELQPSLRGGKVVEYRDENRNMPTDSARIYLFYRPEIVVNPRAA